MVASSAVKFAQHMQESQLKLAQGHMIAILADIEEQSKRLARHPIRAEIERYRRLVGNFVKEAVAHMTRVEKRSDRRNRAFVLVQEVDRKLAELTELLLGGQAKSLDILARLNEIRGMLVDLMV